MNRSRSPLVLAEEVSKSYDGGRIAVLRDVDFSACPGEIVALWGSSGSGKSTLLHLLGGLDAPDRGRIRVCDLDPTLESNRLTLRRYRLGFVFQLHNLIPDLTVEENLRVPGVAIGRDARAIKARVIEVTDEMGLRHRLAHPVLRRQRRRPVR